MRTTPGRTSRSLAWPRWGCRALVAISILFGCGGPPPGASLVVAEITPEPRVFTPAEAEPDPIFDTVGDPAAYLADGFGDRERRRALMRRAGDLFWQLEAAEGGYVDLPAEPDQVLGATEVIVAERHARHLRVVRESRGLRATYYLATSDFHDVATRRATLLTSGGEPFADGCGVTIPAGSWVEARPPKIGYRRVVFRRSWIATDGVLPEGGVDVLYRYAQPRDGAPEPEGEPCKIRSPFRVHDGPDGHLIAVLLDDGLHFCTKTREPRDGFVRIAFTHHDVDVVGYVPVERVEPRDPPELGNIGTVGRGGGSGWGASHTTFLFLSPGDALFTPNSRLRVATVVQDDFQVGDEGELDGMRGVRFPFQQWGFTTMLIAPETAAAARKQL